MKINKLKKLYERKCKVAQLNQTLSIELDKETERYLGFDLEGFELDFAVDTLNEGYGNLSFEDYIKELDKMKEKFALSKDSEENKE